MIFNENVLQNSEYEIKLPLHLSQYELDYVQN